MPPDEEKSNGLGWRRVRTLLRPGRFSGAVGWTLALRILGLPSQLALFILVARLHDVASVGLFAVVSGIWLSARALGPFGFDRAAMRFIPLFGNEGRDWASRAFVRAVLFWLMIPTFLLGAGLASAGAWLGLVLPTLSGIGLGAAPATAVDDRWILVICGLGLPAYVAIGFLIAVVRARRQVVAAQLPELVIQPLLSLGLVGGVAIVMPQSGIQGTLAVVAFAAWVIALAYLWCIRDLLAAGPRLDRYEWRGIVATCFGIGLAKVITVVTQRGPLFIVIAVAGASAAGLYESAHRLALLGTLGTWAIGAAVSPMMAEAHADKDANRLRTLLAGSILVSSGQAAAVLLLLIAFGDWLLGLFGDAFVVGHMTAVVLALAYLVNGVGGPVSFAFYMIGRERLVLGFNLASALTMAVAVPVGAAASGPLGAALGYLLALIVGDGCMAVAARPVLGIGLRDLHPGRLATALLGADGRDRPAAPARQEN